MFIDMAAKYAIPLHHRKWPNRRFSS